MSDKVARKDDLDSQVAALNATITAGLAERAAALASLQVDVDADEVRLATAETDIDALQAASAAALIGYTTKAAMDADLAHPAGTLALVTNDPTPANNITYIKLGASGAGSWQASVDRITTLDTRVTAIETFDTNEVKKVNRYDNLAQRGNLPDGLTGVKIRTAVGGNLSVVAATAAMAAVGIINTLKYNAGLTGNVNNYFMFGPLKPEQYGKNFVASFILDTNVAQNVNLGLVVLTLKSDGTIGATLATVKEIIDIGGGLRLVRSTGTVHVDQNFPYLGLGWSGVTPVPTVGAPSAFAYHMSGWTIAIVTDAVNKILLDHLDFYSWERRGEKRLDAVESRATALESVTVALPPNYIKNQWINGDLADATALTYTGSGVLEDVTAIPELAALGIKKAYRPTPPAAGATASQTRTAGADTNALGIVPGQNIFVGSFVYSSDGVTWPANHNHSLRVSGVVTQLPASVPIQVSTHVRFYWAIGVVGAGVLEQVIIGFASAGFVDSASTRYHGGFYAHSSNAAIAAPTLADIPRLLGWDNQGPSTEFFAELIEVVNERKAGITVSELQRVTILNSDRILISGDSYTESFYTLKDKAYIQRLSALLDYLVESNAVSGHTYAQAVDRLRNNGKVLGNALGPQDFNITYSLAVLYTNDLSYYDYPDFFNDMRIWLEDSLALGSLPIVATEYMAALKWTSRLLELVSRYNALSMMLDQDTAQMQGANYANFWGGGSHPATRSNELWLSPMHEMLAQLPTPRQALKIFRKRPGYVPTTDADLMAVDVYDRVRKWKELTISQISLSDADAVKYDRLTEALTTTTRSSEYLLLAGGTAVAFADYALVECTLPVTRWGMTDLALKIVTADAPAVYARNVLQNPGWIFVRHQSFTVGAAVVGVAAGDVYQVTTAAHELFGINFTVVDYKPNFGGGILTADPFSSSGGTRKHGAACTLTKQSGAGPAVINATEFGTGFDGDWYDRYGKADGSWVALAQDPADATRWLVPVTAGALQLGKVQFLIKKLTGFSLSGCEVQYIGGTPKPRLSTPTQLKLARPRGAELVPQPLVGTAHIAAWTVSGGAGMVPFAPADANVPAGADAQVVEMGLTDSMYQAIVYAADNDEHREAIVEIVCRTFPDIFIAGYVGAQPITPDTYDYATLEVELDFGGVSIFQMQGRVGLHWRPVRFPIVLPHTTAGFTLRLRAKEKKIQVAKASVKIVAG